jgi:hypothetical protein
VEYYPEEEFLIQLMFQAEPVDYYPEEGFIILLMFQVEPLDYCPEKGTANDSRGTIGILS